MNDPNDSSSSNRPAAHGYPALKREAAGRFAAGTAAREHHRLAPGIPRDHPHPRSDRRQPEVFPTSPSGPLKERLPLLVALSHPPGVYDLLASAKPIGASATEPGRLLAEALPGGQRFAGAAGAG